MIPRHELTRIVSAALHEDAPWADATVETFVPAHAQAHAALVAREPGVFSGAEVFAHAFTLTDPTLAVQLTATDGERFAAGQTLATVSGAARGILTAERVALNFTQRMSGIATLTAAYVDAVGGAPARITDTRKTTPGLRILERYAVRCGGGYNHRFSLSDAVMVKDNHLAVLTSQGLSVTEALVAARAQLPHTMRIEVEVDDRAQIAAVLAAGVDVVMLDNFSLEDVQEAVAEIAGRAIVEASGGVSLDTVADIAAAGVDVISVGALTHSARAIDLGLDVQVSDGR